jgi:hypothetical protein
MPDWRRAIREKLAGAAISRRQREDLITELANHLEDLHSDLLASGVAEQDASEQCLEELNDVQQIAAAAKRSQIWEDAMNQRSRTLWLPGLVTLTIASVSLMVLQMFTFSRPRVHWFDGGEVVVAFGWLLSLVPCGALGAYLSRRAGGLRRNSIIASLFPSLVMLAVSCFVLPVRLFVEHNTYLLNHPWYFGRLLLTWIVVPGFALLLGALPVLWRMSNRVQTGATPHIA